MIGVGDETDEGRGGSRGGGGEGEFDPCGVGGKKEGGVGGEFLEGDVFIGGEGLACLEGEEGVFGDAGGGSCGGELSLGMIGFDDGDGDHDEQSDGEGEAEEDVHDEEGAGVFRGGDHLLLAFHFRGLR